MQRRGQTGRHTRDARDDARDGHHDPVDRRLAKAGQGLGCGGEERTQAQPGQQQAEQPAGRRNHGELEESQADDVPSLGAERDSGHRGELPSDGIAECQADDVHGGDAEEHQSSCEQCEQGRPLLAEDRFPQGQCFHAGEAVLVGPLGTERFVDAVQVRHGLLDRHARSEPANGPDQPGLQHLLLRAQGKRQPRVCGLEHHRERGRHDADDLAGLFIDVDDLADDRGIAAISPLPEVMADDDHARLGQFLTAREDAARFGPPAQHVEEPGRDERPDDRLG